MISQNSKNKKVLLRERKRHTARRVATAIFCYWGGGGSLDKKFFFPVWTCIKPNLVSKNFSLYWGGGGVPQQKIFFPSLNMYQAKSGVKKIFPFTETGTPPAENLRPGTPPPPPKIWDLGPPPPVQGWIRYPPPRNVNILKLLPSPILRMTGGIDYIEMILQ